MIRSVDLGALKGKARRAEYLRLKRLAVVERRAARRQPSPFRTVLMSLNRLLPCWAMAEQLGVSRADWVKLRNRMKAQRKARRA